MPIIPSAIKKLRQDRKKEKLNREKKRQLKSMIKTFNKEKTVGNFKLATSLIDRLAKKRIIHKNKAARMKSCLAKKIAK